MVWAKCSFLLLQEVVLIAAARLERLKCTVQINLFCAYSTESTLHLQTKSALNIVMMAQADPSGRAVKGVGQRALACWNCGLESRWGQGCLSLVNVLCCQVEVSECD
jgi:hypothetical protein